MERHALEALAREEERFVSEKNIGRTVLDHDIPSTEAWIDAALTILQFGPDQLKAQFTLASHDERDAMVKSVQRAGGLRGEYGKWVTL